MITERDTVRALLPEEEMRAAVEVAGEIAPTIRDRADLHARDSLERFIHVLLGEVAERIVLRWLHAQAKFAAPAPGKTSGRPDPGHDLLLLSARDASPVRCSVKSSLSAHKTLPGILSDFTLATKESELRPVNVQVYFWLRLHGRGGHRVTVPSARQAAIVGWVTPKDVGRFDRYATERREAPRDFRLREMRPMRTLLDHLL